MSNISSVSFSLCELIVSFLFAFVFILIFYVQKVRYPTYYFSFGELIYGIKTSIKLKAFLIRFIIIFIFGFILSLLFSSLFITCFSAFLGSFLIVWPAILNPNMIDYRLSNKRKLVILFYVLFVFSSVCIAYCGFLVSLCIKPAALEYFGYISGNGRSVILIGNIVVPLIISSILLKLMKSMLGIFDKEIKLSGSHAEKDEKE